MFGICGIGETRPSGTGIKFGVGAEEFDATGPALIHPFFFALPVFTGKRHFRAFLSEDPILVWAELLFPVFF